MLQTPAAVRGVSLEPLLGPMKLRHRGLPILSDGRFACLPQPDGTPRYRMPPRLDHVIVGGESGPGARPCEVAWVRSIVEQCREADVRCFVKQLGANPYDVTRNAGLAPGVASTEFNVRWQLRDRKGGTPSEWPEDLRVREYPEARHAS